MDLECIEESIRYLFTTAEPYLHRAAYYGDTDTVKAILKRGGNVNAIDENLSTPLHFASMMIANQTDTIRLILDYNPLMNEQDDWNQSPLNILITRAKYDLSLLQLYLDAGADPNLRDALGHTALHHIVIFPLVSVNTWIECIILLIKNGADVNSTDLRGNTPLHLAAKYEFHEVAEILLENHANLHITNAENESPIDIAFRQRSPNVLDILGQHILVQYSLQIRVNDEHVKRILEMERFQEIWKECNIELDKLKKDKIGDSLFSYFHLMTLPPYQMANVFRNEKSVSSVLCYKRDVYNIFEKSLYDSLTMTLTRSYAARTGYQFREHVLPWMPEMVMDKIISFLSNEDLKTLARVIPINYSLKES